jgi:hypothetical protein
MQSRADSWKTSKGCSKPLVLRVQSYQEEKRSVWKVENFKKNIQFLVSEDVIILVWALEKNLP